MTEENSTIQKFLRDPLCFKISISILSFIQLLILGLNSYGDIATCLTINILTFFTSLVVISVISAKKTDCVANRCLFKCFAFGKPNTSWNNVYHAYSIIFGSLNLLTVIGNLVFSGAHQILSVFGLITTVIYYIEAYYAFELINDGPIKEVTPRCCCTRFGFRLIKFIGIFPKLMRLIVLAFSIGYFVAAAVFSGYRYRDYYSYYGNTYTYTYRNYYGSVADMNYIIAGIVIFILTADILIMQVKRIRGRVENVFGENFVSYGMRFTLTLGMATFSFVGAVISLFDRVDNHILATIFMFAIFVLTFFMAIAENYIVNATAAGHLPLTNKSLLPKNMPKIIINPLSSSEIDKPLESPEIAGYDNRTLLQ